MEPKNGWPEERLLKIITAKLEEYGMPKFSDSLPAMDILQLIKDAGYRKPSQPECQMTKDPTPNTLKPCPFCGGAPHTANGFVYCINKECAIYFQMVNAWNGKWNKRANPPEAVSENQSVSVVESEVEELAKYLNELSEIDNDGYREDAEWLMSKGYTKPPSIQNKE